jgi:hypothetical protein
LRLIRWIDDQRRLTWWLSALVLVVAAGDAWASRHQINPDGISYLDLANVVFAHGVRAGASVAWSPAYTWLVGGALALSHPSRPHELIVVTVVNLMIVAVVLVAFAWWLRTHRRSPGAFRFGTTSRTGTRAYGRASSSAARCAHSRAGSRRSCARS